MTIAIIGKPYAHYLAFLRQEHPEIEVIVFHDLKEQFVYPDWLTKRYALDFSSRQSVFDSLEHWVTQEHGGVRPQIDALEATYESSVLPKVWVGAFFGCPTISEESALAATDKTIMRRKFMEFDPSITPQFAAVETWEAARAFAQAHAFPLILKPANLMKSLLVTKSSTIDELERNFATAQASIAELYQKYGIFHRTPQLVIEEYLEGPSFSVDCVSDSAGNVECLPVVDLVMARDVGIPDNYNYSRLAPSRLQEADQTALQHVAAQGVRALQLQNAAAHVELVLTATGPKLIEIGARFGGYRPRMYALSFGYEMHRMMLDLSLGQAQLRPSPTAPPKRAFTKVFELFPTRTGRFSHIQNFEEMHALASFYSNNPTAKPGDMVGLSSEGYKFCCSVFLHHQDAVQFEKDCAFVEEHVRVVLQEDTTQEASA